MPSDAFTLITTPGGGPAAVFASADAAADYMTTATAYGYQAETLTGPDLLPRIGWKPVMALTTDADIHALDVAGWRALSIDRIAYHYGAVNTWGIPCFHSNDDPRADLTALLSMVQARQEVARRIFSPEEIDTSDPNASREAFDAADALLAHYL